MTYPNGSRGLRIGLYTSSLPHSHRKPPGVDVFVDRLGEQLACRGHHVVMFTYSSAAPARSYELRTLKPTATATSRLRRMVVAPARLNALDTRGLDILHLHGDDWFYFRRPLPTVRTFHGSALYEARYATRARRRVSQYLTYALELLSARLATASYSVNPYPVPGYGDLGHLPLAFEFAPVASFERSGPPTILFVGTWAGRKRGSLLHETFSREVLPRVPDARLIMVSDHCKPGPGVQWLARPTDEELAELYRSAWVFCMPSSYEGFGQPYVEAMAQGTPVVSSSNPGSRFVLDCGRYGTIAEDARLGDQLVELLLNDRARVALALAGHRRAGAFGWEEQIDAHERAYRNAIAAFWSSRVRARPTVSS